MLRFPLFFGMANFYSRRRRSLARYLAGSVLGIALSLVPLIVVMEVADGMIKGITSRYLELGTYHMEAYIPENISYDEARAITKQLDALDDVRDAFREIRGLGLVYFKGKRESLGIRAVSPDIYERDDGIRRYLRLKEGGFDLKERNSILISAPIAEKLGVHVGDNIQMLALSGSASGQLIPRIKSMKVTGIFTTGYQDLDKLLVYIPFDTGKKLLKRTAFSLMLAVKVKDPFGRLDALKERIYRVLPEGSYLYTWYELEVSQYKSFRTTKALLIFIMALIVLVASLNISSSMVMIVMESRREIAICKAIGAKNWMISLSYTFSGLMSGIFGTILGTAMGVFVSININDIFRLMQRFTDAAVRAFNFLLNPLFGVRMESFQIFNAAYYLDRIPIEVRFNELVYVAFFTIGLSVAASYLPAKKAALFNPIELINRY